MNKIIRLKKLVGKKIWVQTAGSSTQGTLLKVSEDDKEVLGEIHLRPDNIAYSDMFIFIEHIEQIMVCKERK